MKPAIQPTQLIAPEKPNGYGRNAGHPDRKGLGYIARPTNVEPYPDVPQDFVPNTGHTRQGPGGCLRRRVLHQSD